MKIAVLSDIHGNLPALQGITSELEQLDLEAIVAAGDYIGGPKSNEVISLLRSFNCIMIIGNMDIDLLRFAKGKAPEAWSTIKQYGLIRWTFEHIYPEKDQEVLETALLQTVEDVLVCGHIHIPWQANLHGKLVMNPGAVSAPLNGDVSAQYALLHLIDGKWSVEHRAIGYDLTQIRKDYHESGLLEAGGAVSRAFLRSCETGKDFAKAFLDFAYELAKNSGHDDIEYFPDDVWELAVESFPWELNQTGT